MTRQLSDQATDVLKDITRLCNRLERADLDPLISRIIETKLKLISANAVTTWEHLERKRGAKE